MTFRELLTQVREDWKTNHRDWTSPGFRALLAYRLGAWRLTRPPLLRKALYYPTRTLLRYARNQYGIELHATANIGRRVTIAHQGGIVVHPSATIGDDVVIRQSCTVGAATFDSYDRAPVLEDDVHLGAGAVVVGGVRVGRGARIGPNAVVLRNVPPKSLVFTPQSRLIEPSGDQEA